MFLDFLKERLIDFFDDFNRLCVVLIRVCLGEIILMFGDMLYFEYFKY